MRLFGRCANISPDRTYPYPRLSVRRWFLTPRERAPADKEGPANVATPEGL